MILQAAPGASFLHLRALITAGWFCDCAAGINSSLRQGSSYSNVRDTKPALGVEEASNREVFVT